MKALVMSKEQGNVLIQEYDLFRMKPGDTIADVQKQFTHTVNHLIGLGKVFDKEELNIKILQHFRNKILTTLTTAALFKKLKEHELEINRSNEQEHGERKQKRMTLKSIVQKEDSDDECSSSYSETETLTLLTQKFSKFLKKKEMIKVNHQKV